MVPKIIGNLGCSPATMTLALENVKGEKIGELKDDERLLGSYQIDNGCSVRVTDPNAFDWSEVNNVEKQDMDEETYNAFKPTSVKPTVREYKVQLDAFKRTPIRTKSEYQL